MRVWMNVTGHKVVLHAMVVAAAASFARAQDTLAIPQTLAYAMTGEVTLLQAGAKPAPTPAVSTSPPVAAHAAVASSGGAITTGDDGAATLSLGTAGAARLGADTEVRVPREGEKGHSLEMLKGRLFLNISAEELQKRNGSEFRLKTPTALLAVKGTKFFAFTGADGSETIGVHEGSVSVVVRNRGKSVTLAADQAVTIAADQISAVRSLTEDERRQVSECPSTMLARTPLLVLPVNGRPPAGSDAPILRWGSFKPDGSNLSARRAVPLVVGNDNSVRCDFPVPGAAANSDVGSYSGEIVLSTKPNSKGATPTNPDGVIAIGCRVRAAEMSFISMYFVFSKNNPLNQEIADSSRVRFRDGEWHEIMVPLRKAGAWFDDPNTLLKCRVVRKVSKSTANDKLEGGFVEIRDFQVISVPRQAP